MNSYNFNVLSPPEFEEFIRDLLSAEHGVNYASFAEGKDGGIDLRYSQSEDKTTIVQCKRYSKVSSLMSNLVKAERPKLGALKTKPSRYIIVSSLDLSPARVTALIESFTPYIKNEGDILYPKKINAILARHPDVEQRHYKLWISSSDVMRNIINCNVENYSLLTRERINETLTKYAPVPYLEEAMDKLRAHGFIIIAGPPGVGKTVLAEIMSYYLLGDKKSGFQELISIPRDFNDAISLLSRNPTARQVFLFDDFLGTNFLDTKLARHEDTVFKELVQHISNLKRSKALIMTTREYILNQARQSSRHLDEPEIVDSKYILDLSKYSTEVKANILANHIAASGIPREHLEYFIDSRTYKQVIEHRNYSPRLIEGINKKKLWEVSSPEEFCIKIIKNFDEPWSLYEGAFKKEISDSERDVLLVMMSIGHAVSHTTLQRAVFAYDLTFDELKLEKSLSILDGTFVATTATSDGNIQVNFFNPTIYDFLLHYYRDHQYSLLKLIRSAVYLDQLIESFATSKSSIDFSSLVDPKMSEAFGIFLAEKIIINDDCLRAIENKLLVNRHNMPMLDGVGGGEKPDMDVFGRSLKLSFSNVSSSDIDELIAADVCDAINSQTPVASIPDVLKLYEYNLWRLDEGAFDVNNFMQSIVGATTGFEDLSAIQEVNFSSDDYFTNELVRTIGSEVDVEGILIDEALQSQADDESVEGIIERFTDVITAFDLDADIIESHLLSSIEPPEDYDAEFYSSSSKLITTAENQHGESNDNIMMDRIFRSLRS